MLTKRLSICSNLIHHRQILFLPIFSQLFHSANALAIPPVALRLIRRDGPGDRATRNNVVAALITIIVLLILTVWGVWRLVSTARRTIHGTVTSSSYGSGSSSRSGSSFLEIWESSAVRFMRYANPMAPPLPRVRNNRNQPIIIHDARPPGDGPG